MLAIFEWVDRVRWRPQIGDPTLIGWIIVLGYVAAAGLCLRAARNNAKSRTIWILVGVGMLVLAVNKQLDLQTLLTDIGRAIARHDGWYRERRAVQQTAVLATLATASAAAGLGIILGRRFWQHHLLLGSGILVLTTFIALRLISFHHVDHLLSTQYLGLKLHSLLECSGISLIAVAAWRHHPR